MNILLVIDSLGSGGAQRLFANLAGELVKMGHRVDIFVYDKSDFYDDDFSSAGVRIIRADRKGGGFSLIVLSSLIAVYKRGYDRVISAMYAASFYAAIAKLWVSGMALTVCEFSSSHSNMSCARKALFYISTLVADRVICNSEAEATLMRRLPGRTKKISAIWNGYQREGFQYKSPKINDVLTLLVVGRVAYPKNGAQLFKALQLFEKRHGWCPRLLWAGRRDFDQNSVQMYEEMVKIVNSSPGLQGSVEFLGEVSDIESLYHNVDGLIHMSRYEGLPNVICEAMLFGCPVLASAVCDHPLVLGTKNERGLLANPESAEAIVYCIEAFHQMGLAERCRISANAREFAVDHFDITQMALAYTNAELNCKV
ncbi:glycosyltransferase family 4 protein [Alphaproteobacteria bacterium]|nr:glycosyltransferase family 4 protein [Alphaproteobacteria bacterium]MDC1157090.1 glycosyltransferase family 4 protein [Alphaproteobacteria bacterium]